MNMDLQQEEYTENCYRKIRLYFSTFTVSLLYISAGTALGWTSPTLPQLTVKTSWLPLGDAQAAWVASLLLLGGAVGSGFTTAILDLIGRKFTFLVSAIVLIVSWGVLGASSEAYELCIGRFLVGLSMGVIYTAGPQYITEIAEETYMRITFFFFQTAVSIGLVIMFAVGIVATYLQLIFVAIIPPAVFLLFCLWLPESPHYLLKTGQRYKAIKTICWLQGDIPVANGEMEANILETQVHDNRVKEGTLSDLVGTIGTVRALYLSCGLLALQQLSGVSVLLMYTELILLKTAPTYSTHLAALMCGTTMLMSSIMIPPLVSMFGFRKPLICSGLCMAIAQSVLGYYMFLQKQQKLIVTSLELIPVCSIGAFIIAYNIGFAQTPWTIMTDMFPANLKTLARTVTTSFCLFSAFLVTNLYDNVCTLIGIDFMFCVFSFLCLVGVVFTIILLPETKGLTETQIQEIINRPRMSRRRMTPAEISPTGNSLDSK